MTTFRKAELARKQLDRRLVQVLQDGDFLAVPHRGWIRAVRDALGMTTGQLGRRMGISQSSTSALELSEAKEAIQLSTLRRAAEAMNCRLVYALVPAEPLEVMVRRRARQVAAEQLKPVVQNMRLEGQQTGSADLDDLIDDLASRMKTSRIWD